MTILLLAKRLTTLQIHTYAKNLTLLFNLLLLFWGGGDLFIGPQEFVVGYSKAPEQPQSSARPICHSHAMTRTGRKPATIRIAA